jgi:beta-barrel assembly-enhancing protease
MQSLGKIRIIIALLIAGVSALMYFTNTSVNPVTGEKQHVSLTPQQEIAMGLQSAPSMAKEFGGLSQNAKATALVKQVGAKLVAKTVAATSPYKFNFHLLADPRTINAFALPGGQIFITEALLGKLRTEGELAGVLGHEIGHVIERHSAEHMAKSRAIQGGAASVAVLTGESQSAQTAAAMIQMRYGRKDELESDKWGMKLGAEAGYDPRAMMGVMEVLAQASKGARQPEMMSSHPLPESRIIAAKEIIAKTYPNGVPSGLIK